MDPAMTDLLQRLNLQLRTFEELIAELTILLDRPSTEEATGVDLFQPIEQLIQLPAFSTSATVSRSVTSRGSGPTWQEFIESVEQPPGAFEGHSKNRLIMARLIEIESRSVITMGLWPLFRVLWAIACG